MSRGYFSIKNLRASGWEFVTVLGPDIPDQSLIRNKARSRKLREAEVSAFRLKSGEWGLFKKHAKESSNQRVVKDGHARDAADQ